MIDFARLIKEHDHLDLVASRLTDAVSAGVANIHAMLLIRTDLVTELNAHLAAEDLHIYPGLIQGKDTSAAKLAGDFVAEFSDLTSEWADYLESWSADAIRYDWALFADETRFMMKRLREWIQRENSLLYPLALRAGSIRLRAA